MMTRCKRHYCHRREAVVSGIIRASFAPGLAKHAAWRDHFGTGPLHPGSSAGEITRR